MIGNKTRIVEYCWEILRSIDEFEKDKHGCVDDMIGDIQASISSILYYLLQDCDHNDISILLMIGDNQNDKL